MDATQAHNPLGEKMREARQRLQLSQAQAASRAKISSSTWRNIENGVTHHGQGVTLPTRTTPETILAMAHAVELTTTDTRQALIDGGHLEFDQTWRPSELADDQMLEELREALANKRLYAVDVQRLLDQVRQAEDADELASDENETGTQEEGVGPQEDRPHRRTRRRLGEAS